MISHRTRAEGLTKAYKLAYFLNYKKKDKY